MKFLKQCAAFGLAASLLASCSQETPWGANSGEGYLHLRIDALNDVEAAVPAVRAISTDIEVPPYSAFSVSMVKEAGGYSKTWASIDEFAKEESFPVGNYTLSVSYGDEKSQGQVLPNEMGYEHAYYYGETDVTIREGADTEVHLTAVLQNAIVVIEYTEDFKHYFPEYSTIVQPAGGEAINLGSNEALNYVQPGDLSIIISATQQNGKTLTLNPATFTVEGKHMYKLRYNVYNGELGNAVLSIEFDDNLTTQPVTVNLSEDLENARAPQVSLIGPEPGQTLAYAPGAPYTGDAKFAVVADGGMQNAVLTISSDDQTFKLSFLSENNDIDLCAATPVQQQALEDAGIKCIGFFGNKSTMAEVDLSGLFDKLPKGKCDFSFYVRDEYTQVSEPLGFSMTAIPVEKSAVCDDGAPFAENYADIIVGYNGPEPTLTIPFSFNITLSSGLDETLEVLSVEASDAPKTRSDEFPVKYYKYRIKLPEEDVITKKDAFNINVLFNNVAKDAMVVPVNVVYPAHTMTYDAMANQLRWRVSFPGVESKENSDALKEAYMKRLRVFIDGSAKTSAYDADIDAYVINGLTPGQAYNLQTSMQIASTPSEYATTQSVTTETAAGVPNGDFEELTETINTTINQGGQWTITRGGTKHQTKLNMVIKEPNNWKSTNSQTCNLNSSNLNTWYVIPSVFNSTLTWNSNQPEAKVAGIGQDAYVSTAAIYSNLTAKSGENAMIIRNVAWDTNGPSITYTNQTGNRDYSNYYCNNEPSIANRTAGRMYLASGSNEGVNFNNRPKSLKGYYKYSQDTQDTDEKAVVLIELLNGDNIITTKTIELNPASNYTLFEIPLMDKYAFNQVPTTLKISITSTNRSSDIKTTNYCNKDECCSRGAQLTIDNLTFEY